jgi:CubicO group peptidase (beta-lactamase class C family)
MANSQVIFHFRSRSLVLVACAATAACVGSRRQLDAGDRTDGGPALSSAIPAAERDIQVMLDTLRATPGLAVAVVVGDSVVLSRGFGLADVERRRPVTPRTRFYIASVTKAFTAAALARLAETGGVHLDSSLAAYFPNVRLQPPLMLEHISVRDLLAHRSGISNEGITFVTGFSGDYTLPSILSLFADSKPRPRTFAYSNVNYVLAGSVMEKVTGASWQSVIQDQVLTPAGMTATGFSVGLVPRDSIAQGYASHWDGFHLVPMKPDKRGHAAGGMVSNLEDLTAFLRINMRAGVLGNRRVFSERLVTALHAPQSQVTTPGVTGQFSGFSRYAYGLGWYRATYGGRDVIQVLGSYRGSRAHVSFMPDEQLGLVILANEGKSAAFFPEYVAQVLYDRLLGTPQVAERQARHIEDYAKLIQRIRGEAPYPDFTRPKPLPEPSVWTDYVGVYDGGILGKVEIEQEQGALRATLGEMSSYLAYQARDTLIADLNPGSLEGLVTLAFARSASTGEVTELALSLAQGARFRRVRR